MVGLFLRCLVSDIHPGHNIPESSFAAALPRPPLLCTVSKIYGRGREDRGSVMISADNFSDFYLSLEFTNLTQEERERGDARNKKKKQ